MIIQFQGYPDEDCELWKLFAIVSEDSDPIEVGIFEQHELNAACERFSEEYRRMHLH